MNRNFSAVDIFGLTAFAISLLFLALWFVHPARERLFFAGSSLLALAATAFGVESYRKHSTDE